MYVYKKTVCFLLVEQIHTSCCSHSDHYMTSTVPTCSQTPVRVFFLCLHPCPALKCGRSNPIFLLHSYPNKNKEGKSFWKYFLSPHPFPTVLTVWGQPLPDTPLKAIVLEFTPLPHAHAPKMLTSVIYIRSRFAERFQIRCSCEKLPRALSCHCCIRDVESQPIVVLFPSDDRAGRKPCRHRQWQSASWFLRRPEHRVQDKADRSDTR